MKIGLDMAHFAYKKLVDGVILFTADRDFISSCKVARVEGLNVLIDTLGSPKFDESLYEHSDKIVIDNNVVKKLKVQYKQDKLDKKSEKL